MHVEVMGWTEGRRKKEENSGRKRATRATQLLTALLKNGLLLERNNWYHENSARMVRKPFFNGGPGTAQGQQRIWNYVGILRGEDMTYTYLHVVFLCLPRGIAMGLYATMVQEGSAAPWAQRRLITIQSM